MAAWTKELFISHAGYSEDGQAGTARLPYRWSSRIASARSVLIRSARKPKRESCFQKWSGRQDSNPWAREVHIVAPWRRVLAHQASQPACLTKRQPLERPDAVSGPGVGSAARKRLPVRYQFG